MVVGARTIKAYGWETHYLEKLKEARSGQVIYVFLQGLIGFLGLSVFQNGGLIVTIAIFIPKWMNGELLDESVSISVMAMVFFLFISINAMTYYAMTTLQQFSAVIQRMSSVFEMEEYATQREIGSGESAVEFD